MFHVLYVLQKTQKIRGQNMRFEIVTAETGRGREAVLTNLLFQTPLPKNCLVN